jgi:hypothetical protein
MTDTRSPADARAKREKKSIYPDRPDWARVMWWLRYPKGLKTRAELADLWAIVTDFYLPRQSDEEEPLQAMKDDPRPITIRSIANGMSLLYIDRELKNRAKGRTLIANRVRRSGLAEKDRERAYQEAAERVDEVDRDIENRLKNLREKEGK